MARPPPMPLREPIIDNGDGTGTLTATLLSINHNMIDPGDKPVTQFDVNCILTYVVHADDIFTEMLTYCDTTVIIAGPGTGPTFRTTGIEHKGLFANGRKSFVFGSVNPNNIEETKNAAGDIVSKAICSRSGTAFKVN